MILDSPEMNILQNPFVVESPERLTAKDIVNLFVESYTSIEVVKQRKHTFVWGSRGAGKSMMLRYLEPRCQFLSGIDTSQKLPFLAIYCPCKEGYFNKTDLGLLPNLPAAILTEHLLNIYIAGKTLDCLRKQFEDGYFNENDLKTFSTKVMNLFDVATMAKPISDAAEQGTDSLEWLQTLFIGENRRINVFLRQSAFCKEAQPYTGVTTGYHDFLLPFMETVQSLPKLEDVPILVMLDDADRLTANQQVIIRLYSR